MEALLTPQKLENAKRNLQIYGGIKLKKREGGVVMNKMGLKIFVLINAKVFAFITFVTNTPFMDKKHI